VLRRGTNPALPCGFALKAALFSAFEYGIHVRDPRFQRSFPPDGRKDFKRAQDAFVLERLYAL
jgi:hypothetical protein